MYSPKIIILSLNHILNGGDAVLYTQPPRPTIRRCCHLIHTFEWRHGLALGLIERRVDNIAVLQLDVGGVDIVLE